MSSASKFWPSKKKNEKSVELSLSFSHIEAAVEQHLRALNIIKEEDDVTIDFPMGIQRTKPVAIKITTTNGGVSHN